MKGYFICSPLYLLTIRNTWHYFYLEYYLEFITIIPSLSHTTPIRLFPGYTRFGGHDHGCVDFGKRLWLCLKAHTSVISFISLSFPYQILPTKYGTLDTYLNTLLLILLKDNLRIREMRSREHSEIWGSLSFKLVALNRSWSNLGSGWL